MFDSHAHDQTQRPLKAVPVAHLSREGRWSLDTPRSYLVPALLWFTSGQGRLSIDGEMRGFTAHNAIYLPATTRHSLEICGRTQGTALFLGAQADLPAPRETMHLRLTALSQQIELNELVEGFRRDAESNEAFSNDMLHHRAALIALWLTRQQMAGRGRARQTPPTRSGAADHG